VPTTKELTDQQKLFIKCLVGEAKGDPATAKKMAGYAPSSTTSSIINNLRDEILEATNDLLVSNGPKAALGLVGLLDTPDAMGARNKINVANSILDRIGIVKKEQVEHKIEGASIFILPAKVPS